MAKVGIVPLKILRRIVELDKDKDGEMLVAIHFPSDEYIVEEEVVSKIKEPGTSFYLFDQGENNE